MSKGSRSAASREGAKLSVGGAGRSRRLVGLGSSASGEEVEALVKPSPAKNTASQTGEQKVSITPEGGHRAIAMLGTPRGSALRRKDKKREGSDVEGERGRREESARAEKRHWRNQEKQLGVHRGESPCDYARQREALCSGL